MAEVTLTSAPGKRFGQQLSGRSLKIYDLVTTNLQGAAVSPAITASVNTPEAPAIRLVSGDKGGSGLVTNGNITFVSDGTTTAQLYSFSNFALSSNTATITRSAPGGDRERKLLGAALRVYDFASVADGDTFTSGITGIIDYAYESALKALDATESNGVFTFSVTSGPASNVRLLVWSES